MYFLFIIIFLHFGIPWDHPGTPRDPQGTFPIVSVYYSPGDRAQKVIPGGSKTNESFWKSQNNIKKSILRFPSFVFTIALVIERKKLSTDARKQTRVSERFKVTSKNKKKLPTICVYCSPADRARKYIPRGAKTNESFWKSQNKIKNTFLRWFHLNPHSGSCLNPHPRGLLCWDNFVKRKGGVSRPVLRTITHYYALLRTITHYCALTLQQSIP